MIRPPVLLLAVFLVFPVIDSFAAGDAESPVVTQSTGTVTVTDSLRREVSLAAAPERILLAGRAVLSLTNAVYLFPEARDRVIGIGVTDQGLGDFLPVMDIDFARKARYDNSAGAEQLAGLQPDLVILKHYLRDTLGLPLEKLAIPVVYLNLETPAQFYDDIATLGALFANPDRAALIRGFYEGRVAEVTRRVGGAEKPSVLLISHSSRGGDTVFNVPPASWLQTSMIETAGGKPVWRQQNPGQGWLKVGIEQIAAWDPSWVFVVSYRSPAAEVVAGLAQSDIWKALGAAREGRIRPFPADFYSWDQPDPRWILGLQWVAATLHPESFADRSIRDEIRTFYSELYGLDGAVIDAEIMPRLDDALDVD